MNTINFGAPIAVDAADTNVTVSEMISAYLRAYSGKDNSRYQRCMRWVAMLGDIPAAEVTPRHVRLGLKQIREGVAIHYSGKDAFGNPIYKAKRKPVSESTINRYKDSLAAAYTWAINDALMLPEGFMSPTRAVKKGKESEVRVRYLSNDQLQALLSACKASGCKKLYLLVLMASTTGARRGELLGLRWRDVNWSTTTALLEGTKNGDRRSLMLTSTVLVELEKIKGHPDALVFAGPGGRAINPANAFNRATKAAAVKDFRFHDLRHHFASTLVQNKMGLQATATLLGHRSTRMTERYAHLDPCVLGDQARTIFAGVGHGL